MSWTRYQEPARKEASRQNTRNMRLKYPDRYKARTAVGNAIANGKLERKPCEICGEKAQAHHENYAEPLNVRWLCFKHHRFLAHGQLVEK